MSSSCARGGARAGVEAVVFRRCIQSGGAAVTNRLRLGRPQLTRMRDFSSRDWANRGCLYGRHSRRLPVERHELDLESFAVGVDVNHCPNVTAFQTFGWHRCRQHDAIELVNHLALRGNLDVGGGAARLWDRHALCLEAVEMKRNRALHLSLDFVARTPGGDATRKVRRVRGEASPVCSITIRYFMASIQLA